MKIRYYLLSDEKLQELTETLADIKYFNELLVLENSDLESRFLEPDRWTIPTVVYVDTK